MNKTAMDIVEPIPCESAERQQQAVDLLLWKSDCSGADGGPGAGSELNPHRVLEIGPEGDELVLYLVVQRRAHNQWVIDEAATTKFYLNASQVEYLRTYLNDLDTDKGE